MPTLSGCSLAARPSISYPQPHTRTILCSVPPARGPLRRHQIVGRLPCEGDVTQLLSHLDGVQ